MPKARTGSIINIGASAQAIAEAKTVIVAIIGADCDESTKVEALRALTAASRVENTTISNCNFEVGK